jgi:ketosteroid isomerase-like protein
MEAENTKLVKDAYAAFQRGDIPAVLATLSDDVEWHAVKGTEGVVPTSGLRRGRAAVGEFFQQLANSTTFESFEPREFIAQGDQVAVIGRYKGKAIPTGKPYDSEWVMVFTVRNGKVVRFREFADSRQLVAAFQ